MVLVLRVRGLVCWSSSFVCLFVCLCVCVLWADPRARWAGAIHPWSAPGSHHPPAGFHLPQVLRMMATTASHLLLWVLPSRAVPVLEHHLVTRASSYYDSPLCLYPPGVTFGRSHHKDQADTVPIPSARTPQVGHPLPEVVSSMYQLVVRSY
jgi:hypothetical protein